jgi:hypothetical protein
METVDLSNRPAFLALTVGQVLDMAYTVKLNVSDGTYTQNTTTTVYPAATSQGMTNVGAGTMVIAADGDMSTDMPFPSYAWTLTCKETDTTRTPPVQKDCSPAPVLHDADKRNPWFIATKVADYTLVSNAAKTWAASTTYSAGDYVQAANLLYKTAAGGTSGSTAPSAMSSVPVDGTVNWTFIQMVPTLTVHADKFAGMSSCVACHGAGSTVGAPTAQYAAWPSSAHANFNWRNSSQPAMTLFQAGINGIASSHYNGACVECHTVGSEAAVKGNDGFSDRAAAEGWVFPSVLAATNYDSVPADLKQLNGIQCENCHGPVNPMDGGAHRPAVSYNAQVCARCHDEAPNHDKYELWQQSPTGHSLRSLALRGAADRSNPNLSVSGSPSGTGTSAGTGYASYGAGSCARCHTAQGFAAYVQQQLNDKCAGADTTPINQLYDCYLNPPGTTVGQNPANFPSGYQTTLLNYYTQTLGLTAANVEPQTCQTCHDPHTTQLRLTGDTHMLMAGFRVQNAGQGALCMLCHNGRNGVRNDTTTAFPNAVVNTGSSAHVVQSIATAHDATQAEVLAGENAFFIAHDGNSKSKHLTYLKNSCADCHVNIAGPSGSKSAYGPNHTFKVDGTICATCHSQTAAQVLAVQDQFDAAMAAASTAIGNAALKALQNAVASAPTATIKVGTVTKPVSAISAIAGPTSSGTSSLKFTFNDTTPATTATASLTSITWVANLPTGATAGDPAFSLTGLLARGIWNYYGLATDGSRGVHNPTFTLTVLANTKTAIDNYTNSGTLYAGVAAP